MMATRNLLFEQPPRSRISLTADSGTTLAEIVGATIGMATEFDNSRRAAIGEAMSRAGVVLNAAGTRGINHELPFSMSRGILPTTVNRTGVGYVASGPGGYGDTLKVGMAEDVLDRRRPKVTPCGLVDWWDVPTRQYVFPVVAETSRVAGQRWGGMTSTWGLGETALPAAVDAKVAQITFSQARLLIYTTVSRDVWEDAAKLERWLNVVALSEVRFNIDQAIMSGVVGGPQGVINGPATVTVPKGSTGPGAITSANIDAMWSSLYAGGRENCVWMAQDSTIQYIDQLGTVASGSQTPETPYIGYAPAGRYGVPFPTLKGRPLIACEALPAIGTLGDLVLWDPTDYIFTYLKSPIDIGNISISVDVPPSKHATGMIGLPENAVERRMSDQALWNLDELAIIWKFRGDGRYLWNSTVTNINGQTLGPAVVLATR